MAFVPSQEPASADFEKLKEEILNHVHMENVRCYRNTQAAIQTAAEELLKKTDESLNKVYRLVIATVVIEILCFAAAMAIFMKLFGII